MSERLVKGIWVPIEIWEANDLSWNEKILLMEIDSFTTQGKDCFISDEYIADLLKTSERTARTLLSDLIEKGYVARTRFDGRRRFLESTMHVAFAEQSGKICRAERKNLPNTNTNILKEEDKSSSNNIRKASRYDFKKALIEIGVSEQTASDWMEVRKEKKATNTETAFKKVQKEIGRSGATAEECIRLAVENSWRGFEAEWMLNQRQKQGKKVSVLENNMNVAEELMRMSLKI